MYALSIHHPYLIYPWAIFVQWESKTPVFPVLQGAEKQQQSAKDCLYSGKVQKVIINRLAVFCKSNVFFNFCARFVNFKPSFDPNPARRD